MKNLLLLEDPKRNITQQDIRDNSSLSREEKVLLAHLFEEYIKNSKKGKE
jgi:hypothetical protein